MTLLKTRPTPRAAEPPTPPPPAPPAAPPPDPLGEWATRLRNALNVLLAFEDHFRPPPGQVSTPEQLCLLLDLRARFAVNGGQLRPHEEAAESFAARVAGDARRASMADATTDILKALDTAVGVALDRGLDDERLIRTGDFANVQVIELPATSGPHARSVWLAVGLLDSLAENHPLRSALPVEDYFLFSPTRPGIVLGPTVPTMHGLGPARLWYVRGEAFALTLALRGRQRRDEEEKVENERLEALREREKWWNSPLGVQELLNRRLEKLKQKGPLPEEVEHDPAVRQGGPV